MFGIGRRKKDRGKVRLGADASDNLFAGLLRGHNDAPLATFQSFPTAEELAARTDLRFDPATPDGKILMGLVGAQVKTAVDDRGRITRWPEGGTFIGIDDDRHLLTCAGSRTGKARSLIIPVLYTYRGSTVVIDPKGDLATETAAFRKRRFGHRVFVVDPFRVCGESAVPFVSTFNPLQGVDETDVDAVVERAALIADALILPNPDSKDPHWDDAARQLLETVVLHVLTDPRHRQARNLTTVHKLLDEKVSYPIKDPELAVEMYENEFGDGMVLAGARAHFDREAKEASSVLSSLRRHLHCLRYKSLRRTLENGTLDLSMLHDGSTTIYLSMPATQIAPCAGFLRLFVNLTLASFERNPQRRTYQHGGKRLPVLVCLDEFASLRRLSRVEDAAGQLAGLGCKLWPIVQDLGQLKAIYGDRWETFIANAGAVTFFGQMDLTTLEYLEKRLGSTLVYTPCHSQPTRDAAVSAGALGRSFGVTSHPLMTISEIARTFGRDDPQLRMLVLMATTGPVILQRALYDRHPVLRKLQSAEQS